jgi:integrase
MLFEELADRWLASIKPDLKPSSYGRRVTAITGLKPFFKGELVSKIGAAQIEAWKIKRGVNLAPQTYNIEAETLRLMLGYARDTLRILIDNPAESIKRRKPRAVERLTPNKEDFRRLVASLRSGHRATGEAADFIEFLAYSGARQAEAAAVRWRNLDFNLGKLTITGGDRGTKNHQHRVLPLFPPLHRLLNDIRSRKKPSAEDAQVFGIGDALLQLHRACKRLGLPQYGHHSMRHFFCSNCIEAGVDFLTLSRRLGHSDGGVLVGKTYGHMRQEHSTAMAARIVFDAGGDHQPPSQPDRP